MSALGAQRVRLDVAEVARRFGRHPVTLARWELQGLIARSHRVFGRRCWYEDEVEAAEQFVMTLGRRDVPREKALALAASGRAARAAKRRAKVAAKAAAAAGGADWLPAE